MSTTTKEPVASSPAPAQESTPASPGAPPQAAPRTDPIGIEIPVVVHASRYSAATKGLSKPLPPVHEETRTVIVFAQGAVVRLTSSLSIGETVVLTNQQTGADVLCRVASVKAQTGIQNYVDLEFTQRAPGFWNKLSSADAASRSVVAVPEATPKSAPAILPPATPVPMTLAPVAPAPAVPASLTPAPAALVLESIPAPQPLPAIASPAPSPKPAPPPLVAEPRPAEPPRVETLNAPPELEPRRPVAVPTVARASSSVVAGVSAGMRQAHPGEPSALGGGLDWTKENPARSKKGLIAAVALLAVGGLAGGAYLLTHRGPSEQTASAITVAASSAPLESRAPAPAGNMPAPALPNSATAVAPAPDRNSVPQTVDERPVDVPRPVRRDPAPGAIVEAEPAQSVNPPPLRPAVQIGTLKTPVLRRATILGSSEPPPALSPDDSKQDVLRSGVLSGGSGANAPAPPAAPASPEPVKIGGQLQMPKAISSPQPVYPEIARAQGIEGLVVMDALVDATGTVSDVKVTSGPPVLRQAAMDALRRWKYQPARLNGQPTSVHVNVSIHFSTR